MKCPKCGFVSYPGLDQCKKCGHPFKTDQAQDRSSSSPSSFSDGPGGPEAPRETHESREGALELTGQIFVPQVPVPEEDEVALSTGSPPTPAQSPPRNGGPDWRQELNQRIESFRQRRARIRGMADSSSNMEFDFDDANARDLSPSTESPLDEPLTHSAGVDIEFDNSTHSGQPAGLVDSLELNDHNQPRTVRDPEELEHEEFVPEGARVPRRVEFVLDSAPRRDEHEPLAVPIELPLPPLRRRFVGGLIDAAVLMLAAGVFALIFSRAGGHLTPTPLNLAVLGFIIATLGISYFGAFTAITSTTPGLLWVGIEVRNMSGSHPTPRQAFWRAFGYLVSASALMLGFVWALVDNEGLTWHDRMSDTFLTASDGGSQPHASAIDQ